MNIRPMNHLFADDMFGIEHARLSDEEKAILTADYTPADRNEAASLAILNTVQGRPEQAWTPRRCSPEMAVYDPTEDDQSDSADGEVLRWLRKLAAYVAGVGFAGWFLVTLTKAWS